MSTIDQYTAVLASRLSVSHRSRAAILEEVRDHLIASAEHACSLGTPCDQAETGAVMAFGSAASMARQFNAAAGVRAMRRAPIVALATGATVVVAFLVAAVSQPQAAQQATPSMQVSFFLGVLAFQVAVIAGACGASRALATWRTSATSGHTRELVRRCTITSMTALFVGVLAVTTNLILDAGQASNANGIALAAGGAGMSVAVAVGLRTAVRLNVNAFDDDTEAGAAGSPALFTLGELAISVVHRYPVVSCAAVTMAAAGWAMAQAETTTIVGSLPWGIGEAVAVVAAFVLLGPVLGLRAAAE